MCRFFRRPVKEQKQGASLDNICGEQPLVYSEPRILRGYSGRIQRTEDEERLLPVPDVPKKVRPVKRVRKTNLPRNYDEQDACDADVTCSICFVHAVRIVYVPCGHITACLACTRATMNKMGTVKCSVCARRVVKAVKFFEAGFE
jgi:hypothetical protein